MKKTMLIERDPHQTRIAVLEDDRLAEVALERHLQRGLVGNLYKGRVTRVLPGMQAAFVDLGLERDAFLYVSDALVDDEMVFDGRTERDAAEAIAGGDSLEEEATEARPSIVDLLKAGQEIVVQVRKDAIAGKGARVSAHVTLPSRYLVLLPGSVHLGISRRIQEEVERDRLRQLLVDLRPPSAGLIARTEAAGSTREELEADVRFLTSLWSSIERRAAAARAPSLLHGDLGLALRVVRDVFGGDFDLLWVDGEELYEEVVEFLAPGQPELVARVQLDERESGLFERFGVDKELAAALDSKVWLRSGGYLVINPTEALVAIDVNTGKYVGRDSLEETIFRTNLEAVREIVRQIRIRDLGGIVVLDLIDMELEAHRTAVFSALEAELEKDRARTRVLNISEFGLVELTRKRSRSDLLSQLAQSCPYCHGSGRVKSTATVCLELRREVLKHRRRWPRGGLLLRAHPDVVEALEGEERGVLEDMESRIGGKVLLRGDPQLHHEQFDVLEL
ncbi:MAG TPA: Rne/Rng family ribonuclease [Thermoanaerobaculia bacterium]|nr:Rne/Rng family ribonuclease [Thermoanaerobaculia bacterium]